MTRSMSYIDQDEGLTESSRKKRCASVVFLLYSRSPPFYVSPLSLSAWINMHCCTKKVRNFLALSSSFTHHIITHNLKFAYMKPSPNTEMWVHILGNKLGNKMCVLWESREPSSKLPV